MTSRGPDGESDAGVAFSQSFQKVSGRARIGEINASMRQVRLVGDRIDFEMMDQRGMLRVYEGRVSAERIEGRTVASNGATGSFVATRTGPMLPIETGRE
jgi:hypothetical protein